MYKDKDFNNVGPWLKKKLKERRLSVGKLTLLTDYKITSATIFRWFNDTYRPSVESMDLLCKTLSKVPVIAADGSEHFEEVPLRDGLAQFAPKPKGRASPKYGQ